MEWVAEGGAARFGGAHRLSDDWRSTIAALLAVLLHLLFLGMAFLFFKLFPPAPRPVPLVKHAVSMRTLTRSEWESNRTVHTSVTTSKLPKTKAQEKHEPMPRGQVVDVAPGNNQESADAKYLAETSNTVKKQTRARETTPFYGTAQPRTTTTLDNPKVITNQPVPEQKKGNHGHGNDDRPEAEAHAAVRTKAPEMAAQQKKDLIAMRTPDTEGISISNRLSDRTQNGGRAMLPTDVAVQPGAAEQAASEGRVGADVTTQTQASDGVKGAQAGAAANDALKDVPIGDGTFLNTREWKFAGFMNRVKQAVGAHWDPNSVLAKHRTQLSGYEKQTVLDVMLTSDGAIAHIRVAKTSGDEGLDSEAVAAFERSQPFPNPPRGLVEEDGHIRFAFEFVLELGGRAAFRGFQWQHP